MKKIITFILLCVICCPMWGEELLLEKGANGNYGFINKAGNIVIPYQYESARRFSEGLAAVKKNEKWGFIDKAGNVVISYQYDYSSTESLLLAFSEGYVAVKKNEKWGFIDKTGQMVIPCQYEYWIAPSFFEGLACVAQDGKYGFIDKTGAVVIPYQYDGVSRFFNGLAIAKFNGKEVYIDKNNNWYSTKEEGLFALRGGLSKNSNINSYPIQKDNNITQPQKRNVAYSDVDNNIPWSNNINEKTFAVIIANEEYRREAHVEFAKNDGEIFRQYCLQTLGLPQSNVHYIANATLNDLRYEVDWLIQVAKAYQGEAQLLFYYAGHGVPDEASKSAYLLPVDGNGGNIKTGYRLGELYSQLSAAPSTSTLVFLDACFSGAQRSGDMMASARAIAIEAKPEAPAGGNMVVFSAAQGIETAYPYKGKNHGMFTYYLLKKLQESKGDTSLGELVEYVTKEVTRSSIVENGKSQTPTVIPSATMQESWKNLRLKP